MLITQVKPDMVLAEDILNFQGLLLLRAQTILTEKNIKMLKSWGVTSLKIDGYDELERQEKNEPDKEPRPIMSIEEEMRERFMGVLDNPVMEEILNVAMELKLKSRQ